MVAEAPAVYGAYPPDFFDFIVIDECHRGGANDESNWRGILDYFAPAVQLGLTATPKRDENVDTYRYFGDPVYIYSLKDGINDGFLTPFKVKQIQTTLAEYVYTPDDTVIEGEIEQGKRYEEAALRAIWSAPDTRKRLLQGLAENGFGPEQLNEMQNIIDAEKSDLFDVLAHVACALPPLTREVRATNARVHINTRFSAKQRVFLDFVLQHYVSVGVEELDQDNLVPLLMLKYHNSLADAVADLGGRPEEINKAFAGFQQYLYSAIGL
jgi:type I site-specific restriction endonuclease